MKMRINLQYVHGEQIGYGRLGVKLADALQRMGVQVDDVMDKEDRNPASTVCWVSVPAHARWWFTDQKAMMLTMWESGTLPESFRDTFDNFDRLIVPSEHNLELFSRYHKDVVKIPLGIDTKEWKYVERQPVRERFVFLIGGSGNRKGVDLAYKAFKRLWPTEDSWPRESPRPTMVFKSPLLVNYHGDRIEHVNGRIPAAQERELYGMAHVYLQPSRGEGWGLQPMQAIAQGCPTILTDAHGHAEFADLGWGISATRSKSDYFIHGDAGEWWEPNLDELCDHMLWMYNNYDQALARARVSSRLCHLNYSWERVAERFVGAVGEENFVMPYQGDGSIFTPTQRLYAVSVTKPWPCQIAGTYYQFKPGETTYETSDVKRLLYEAGVLHPDCIKVGDDEVPTEDELGLAPDQIVKLKDYSASHSHCWTCGQQLGSGKLYEPVFEDD